MNSLYNDRLSPQVSGPYDKYIQVLGTESAVTVANTAFVSGKLVLITHCCYKQGPYKEDLLYYPRSYTRVR